MKVIQGTLLYNKIECYNKGVQRSPFCSVKSCTHSSQYMKFVLSTMDQLLLLLRTMVFLKVEMRGNPLIPPDQLAWAIILRLMNISTTRKSPNEHGFFIAVTSLGW